MAKYTPRKQPLRTVQDFSVAQRTLSTHFLNTKMGLAIKAMKAKGMTSGEIAKALDLPKAYDVDNILAWYERGGHYA